MKHGYHVHLEDETVANSNFRKVLYTTTNMQLVLMSLKPGEDIGLETHHDNDQFFRFDAGEWLCIINGITYVVRNGDAMVIPAGSEHNITNTSDSQDLKMYTIYTPAHHKDGIVRVSKADAIANEADFDGVTSE